ncbi:MAG: HD domain-containing phosphohydrolase [Anaerovoracaceae bacterium]
MNNYSKELMKVLDTGIALSKEKDRNKLLSMILEASMEIARCDAGTLYMNKDGFLHFKVMKTISMGVDKGKNGEPIDLPPVPIAPQNICAYTVLKGRPLNIPDVYASCEFDFSGPIQYDKLTGYHTGSMLTIPLINQEDDAVGVMQLINALDEEGNITAFSADVERVILSLASQAAITMTNMQYLEELKNQMWSFTEAMAEAIDARTPYNANHVRNVARYAGEIADYINELHEKGLEEEAFPRERKEQLVMSALLHDLGKMAVPTKIMNKATRLEERLGMIQSRFENFGLRYKVQMLEGKLSASEYAEQIRNLEETWTLVESVNSAGFLDDEKEARLLKAFENVFWEEGKAEPFFTEEEKEDLLIKKGTLTAKERAVMESHVDMTERILNKVHFNSRDKDVAKWAIQHHECLNGKGYPRKLTEEELPLESRILAVADICDALLASDRPYKKPMPREKAFAIMHDMARSGNIDEKLVDYLEQCILQ